MINAAPGGATNAPMVSMIALIASKSDLCCVSPSRPDDGGANHQFTNWAKLAKCSQDTAYRDILDLIERGALEKDPGGGRSTSYSIVPG